MFSFNPHTHAGCDQIQRDWQEKMWGFNPHTHAGCDCITLSRSYRIAHGFNPHTHAGCDSTKAPPKPSIKVSIHTPTQGVTPLIRLLILVSKFQSTHPRRVWLTVDWVGCICESFNPHTHAGCDSALLDQSKEYQVSIHTPTQGVTH